MACSCLSHKLGESSPKTISFPSRKAALEWVYSTGRYSMKMQAFHANRIFNDTPDQMIIGSNFDCWLGYDLCLHIQIDSYDIRRELRGCARRVWAQGQNLTSAVDRIDALGDQAAENTWNERNADFDGFRRFLFSEAA